MSFFGQILYQLDKLWMTESKFDMSLRNTWIPKKNHNSIFFDGIITFQTILKRYKKKAIPLICFSRFSDIGNYRISESFSIIV